MVLSRNAVHAALWLVLTMFCLAVFYVVQDAPFLGVVQVIVYAGAIMVLFLFVIMLIGVDFSDSLVETLRGQRPAAIVLGLGFAGMLIFPIARTIAKPIGGGLGNDGFNGNVNGDRQAAVHHVRLAVRSRVGAADRGCGRRDGARPPRAARPAAPSASARSRAPAGSTGRSPRCPGPGVYARHDSVDRPALLPDGSAGAQQRVRAVPGDHRRAAPRGARSWPLRRASAGRTSGRCGTGR